MSHERSVESEADDDASVVGDTLTFSWDFGVTVPLWDAEGLLSDEPHWLHRALGLSPGLIDDLHR